MPPSVHSPSPDHARHAHDDLLQGGGLQPKHIKRPTVHSSSAGVTTAAATASSDGVLESRSSSARGPQPVTPPTSAAMFGPVRRRKVGAAQGTERLLVQRKKRTIPGNTGDVVARSESEPETTTANSTTTTAQGSADGATGANVVATNQMSSMGMYGSPYGLGMSPYGGMYGGLGMYGGGMMMGGGAGPFSGLNNFLFGFQSVVFSLGQAMQVRSLVRYLHILGVACIVHVHVMPSLKLTRTCKHRTTSVFIQQIQNHCQLDTGNEHTCAAAAVPHGHVLL